MTKQLIVIGTLFIIQSIASCSPCNCDSKARLTTQGVFIGGSDEVAFEDFILYLNPDFSYKGIAWAGFGFSSATACDCPPPKYVYENPIVDFDIYVRDSNESSWSIVTSNFKVNSGENATEIDLQKVIEETQEQFNQIEFDLDITSSIPSNAVFKVELVTELETFVSEELEVLFID